MEKNNLSYFGEKFDHLQTLASESSLNDIRQAGFALFNEKGLPTYKTEEWKYTGVSSLFHQEYQLVDEIAHQKLDDADLDAIRLPGHEQANELVFLNGKFLAASSKILSSATEMVVMPLEEAAKSEYKDLVNKHLNQSSLYIQDGIHALNTSFIYGGLFVYVPKNQQIKNPVYLYHISDTRKNATLAQPRSLFYVEVGAKIQVVKTYKTFGNADSFTNEVLEILVNANAHVEYYKLQNDVVTSNQVGTTHIRQIGKSYVHTLTVSLDGGMIRNNLNIIMDAAGNESHLYGLYLLKGKTHVDNHTLVDNKSTNCYSNELYKGIADDSSTGVFSGRVLVQPHAQKTNAYQSNKNILLSPNASVNTKPQLEIFADDVKCSHGCTIGQLDEEALFYLRSRGISRDNAKAMLLQAFAADVIDQIKLEDIRVYVAELIKERLELA